MQQQLQQQLRTHLEQVVSLTDDEFALILPHFVHQRFSKHELLIREGERVTQAYLVMTGLLKLIYHDAAGKSHILSFALEDWWESDFQAFFGQTPATLTLQCLENTTVWSLSRTSYDWLCAHSPKLAYFFLTKATRGSAAAQQRILSLLTTQAKERYEQLLRQHPVLLQRVSKTQLASYLGVSRETLSRLSD